MIESKLAQPLELIVTADPDLRIHREAGLGKPVIGVILKDKTFEVDRVIIGSPEVDAKGVHHSITWGRLLGLEPVTNAHRFVALEEDGKLLADTYHAK